MSSLGKESLPKSPYRQPNGVNSANALLGLQIFSDLNCQECHRGQAYTDGQVHDVGTLREYSGNRLNEELPGIKTPSLLGVFASAPYLHDGSAETIEDIFTTIGGTVYQGEDASIINGTAGVVSGPEYLRGEGGVGMLGESETVIRFTVASSSAGTGYMRLRYAGVNAAQGDELRYRVNDNSQVGLVELNHAPALSNGENGNVFETAGIQIELIEGDNTISMSYLGGSSTDTGLTIDDLTLSTPDDVARASAHYAAASLSEADMNNLVQFIKEIDTQSAPDDNAEVIIGPISSPIPVPTPTAAPDPTPEPTPDPTEAPTSEPVPEPTSTNEPINIPEPEPQTPEPIPSATPQRDSNGIDGDDGDFLEQPDVNGLLPGATDAGGGGSLNLFILGLLSLLLARRNRQNLK